jgi:hypothetical protein
MVFARSAAVALLLILSGCAAVPTADGQRLSLRSAEFREYVERVFREQNRVADAVAFALDAPGEQDAQLAAAEQELLAACAGVNELATARRDERRLDMRDSLRAARSVPDCERATRTADARLPK